MAVRTITTRLVIDGETAFKQAMTGVNASLREQKSALSLLEEQFKGQANSLAFLTGKQSILSQTYDQQKEKVRALEQAVKDATEVYGAADTVTLRYQKDLNLAQAEEVRMSRALEETAQYLKEAQTSADQTAVSIDEFGRQVKETSQELEQGAEATETTGNSVNTLAAALQAAGLAMTLREIARAIMDCVDASVAFESSMAGVQKVTKMSDGDLAVLGEEIKQLSTEIPTVPTEIAQVVEASARLGIARENLLSFSRVMLDLGESSDLSSEAAATALARFANIAGTSADNYERLGSVIVALGNNFATSESEITEMASRLASAGTLAGLTEAQIMALAAAMSSVGIEAEAGGTAMTQTLTAMEKAVTSGGEKLDAFAKIAGMSAAEFSQAWKTEPISAIQAFIAGLGQLDAQGESATRALEELGLSGIRQSNMLKSLALASETLAGTVELANRAWVENTELAATAAARYDTTEAKMQMASNAANNLKIAIGDALTPALGDLAEAGTDGFSWAAEFVEENPWLVQALTSVTIAVGVTTGGLMAYSLSAKAAHAATTALSAAMAANPIGAVAVAITAASVAMGTFISVLDDAVTRTQDLMANLEASEKAYLESTEAIQQQSDHVQASISVLEELAAAENKTAAQKESIQLMVEELNQSIPGLTLAYDAQTDTLNMTAEAVRQLAQAEAERQMQAEDLQRLSDLYVEQKQLKEQLADAQEELNGKMQNVTQYLGTYGMSVSGLEKSVQDLTAALVENEAEQEALADKLGGVADSSDDAASAVSNAQESMESMADTLESLEEATLYLAGSQDTLAEALREQTEAGSLSLETALKLIDAGYSAALAIDEETGAVTLDRAAYIELAQSKIQEQIAAVEATKASLAAAAALKVEENAAYNASSAYWDAAKTRAAAATAGDAQTLDLQIAALNRAMNSLNSYSGATQTAARSASSASRKIKTQAQQDLEAYKELKAELEHQKALELVTEREYYEKLKEFRDQYLTDSGNVEEYRKVTEQIFKYDKALVDKEAALWEEQTGNLVEELEDRVDAVQKQQQSMESALAGYGELFTVKDGQMNLENIQEDLDALEAYSQALMALRDRGVSGSLLDEVLGMDVDEATAYSEKLLAMSDPQWEEYNTLWETKQRRAAEIAEQFFKEDMDAIETEYDARLAEAMEGLEETAFASGADTAQGLIDGMASREAAVRAQAQALADAMDQVLAKARRVPSNAEVASWLNDADIREPQPVTARDIRNVGAAVVNGVASADRPLYVKVQSTMNVDSREFYTETLPVQRAVARANPEVIDDE